MERFLLTAKVGSVSKLSKGITVPKKATLELDGSQHEAAIQTVDVAKDSFQTDQGTELNFRDSWKYNVAGYQLAKIIGLNMVPPYIEREADGQAASYSWWIDSAMMESDRVRKKIQPPDTDDWNRQMYAARVFHALIYDTDPNLSNLLITPDWQVWLIDFTRAFRLMPAIRDEKVLTRCDRKLLANLRQLESKSLKPKLGRWLTDAEIKGVVGRAAKIVALFDREIAARGEDAVLYDFARTRQPCGIGL
jgi:hypothetical protein